MPAAFSSCCVSERPASPMSFVRGRCANGFPRWAFRLRQILKRSAADANLAGATVRITPARFSKPHGIQSWSIRWETYKFPRRVAYGVITWIAVGRSTIWILIFSENRNTECEKERRKYRTEQYRHVLHFHALLRPVSDD